MKTEWKLCPVCVNHTRDRIRENTILKNYPLYCKQETVINVEDLQRTVIKKQDL